MVKKTSRFIFNVLQIIIIAFFISMFYHCFADIIYLKNGSLFIGKIIKETEKEIVIEREEGTITIPKYKVKSIKREFEVTPDKSSVLPSLKQDEDNGSEKRPKGDKNSTSDTFAKDKKNFLTETHIFTPNVAREVNNLIERYIDNETPDYETLSDKLTLLNEPCLLKYLSYLLFNKATNEELKHKIIVLLGYLNKKDCIEVLLKVLDRLPLESKKLALDALEKIALPDIIPLIVKKLGDANDELTTKVGLTIIELYKKNPQIDIVEILRPLLVSSNIKLVRNVLFLIINLRIEKMSKDLLTLLKSKDVEIRKLSIRALSKLNDSKAWDNIGKILLNDVDPSVRRCAIMCLKNAEKSKIIPWLIQCLKDEDGSVVKRAYWLLQRITHENFEPKFYLWDTWWKRFNKKKKQLLNDLYASNRQKVINAIKSLSGIKFNKKSVVYAIINLDRVDINDFMEEICKALGFLKEKNAIPFLLQRLQHSNNKIVQAAIEALKLITNKDFGDNYDKWKQWWNNQR